MHPNFEINMNEWHEKFGPLLSHTQRWNGFAFIANELLAKDHRVTIIETGCVRVENNWEGDGQSTRVLSDIIDRIDGIMLSVDLDGQACMLAKKLCPSVNVYNEDSIEFLRDCGNVESCDLVFLDSYDYSPPYAVSELHHAGELACVWDRLPSGCLIAVDDCHGEWVGKHAMVKVFMQRMGIEPEIEGYITIWRKP